jgi:hypothetical protein
MRIATRIILTLLGVSTISPATTASIPSDWQVSESITMGPRQQPNSSVEFQAGTWEIKHGHRSRSILVSKRLSGHCVVVARIIDGTGQPNAHLGITIQSSLALDAGKVCLLTGPQGHQLHLTWLEEAQPKVHEIDVGGIGFPVWLKLCESGNRFSAYYSSDGQQWKQVGVPINTFWAGAGTEVFAGILAFGPCELRATDLVASQAEGPVESELPKNWNVDVTGGPDYVGEVKQSESVWLLQGANATGHADPLSSE